MIFNAATQGGIRKEDINAELLQTLDPDFIADNIAEGVDLFGLIGTRPEGAKFATGTVTGSSSATIAVTGLDFTPTNVMMGSISQSGTSPVWWVADNKAWASVSGLKSYTVTPTYTDGGFSLTHSSISVGGKYGGTYRWVAWAD